MVDNPHTGSSLEDMLREDGIYEETKEHAIKSILARKIYDAMEQQKLTKSAMAERMQTSRSQLDRLLDPDNDSVTLGTLRRAALAVGMQIEIDLRPCTGDAKSAGSAHSAIR